MGMFDKHNIAAYDGIEIPKRKIMSDSVTENPYIGPNGSDVYSEEELNAMYASIKEAEMKRDLALFYSLPLNIRQEIMKQYNLNYIMSLENGNLSRENGIRHK